MSRDEKKELIAWLAVQVRGEVQRALNAQKIELADAIGRELAAERIKHRALHQVLVNRVAAFEQRAALDAPEFDLRDERRRRSGTAA